MVDIHGHPAAWGVMPVLFRVGGYGVSSYSFFVLLGLAAGLFLYFHESRRVQDSNENTIYIAVGSIAGGIIGAKVLEWAINYRYVADNFQDPSVIFSGRTIVGGLIGGVAGSLTAKKLLGITGRKGNLFAPAIAAGVAIGRVGCFMRGCCYGKPTSMPWGVDFGDGIMRHPTQLYESAFMAGMFFLLLRMRKRTGIKPGYLFTVLMLAYFIFRFFLEFVRVEKYAFGGLTVFQVISCCVIVYLLRFQLTGLFHRWCGRAGEART